MIREKKNKTNPKYPVYIISKGRAKTGQTRKALTKMDVPFYVVVEPQEFEEYAKEIPEEKILTLPFSNLGKGSGPARNWCWEHSISNGAKRHWLMDDNINNFYRLHKNRRIPVNSGIMFRICEDFVDRFENVPISGLNYMGFAPENQKQRPYEKNTRVYSCILIENSCKHKWRGKFNEDTDLSLRVLKDGDCTILFNQFLGDKVWTQAMKGGNTDQLYKTNIDLEEKYWIRDRNPLNTLEKSQMIVDMHPDVCKLVVRYGRVHHVCDYSRFKRNQLVYKKEFKDMKHGINNYGMKLVKIDEEGNPIEEVKL